LDQAADEFARDRGGLEIMCATQKEAWFSLAVIGLALVVVVVLIPVLGFHRATSGFGALGLLGLSPLFYRKKHGRVVADERDAAIQRRAGTLAYAVFYLIVIIACIAAPRFYGDDGSVPVRVVQASLWWLFSLTFAARSLATLVQYGRG
jgi:hypothetical protein